MKTARALLLTVFLATTVAAACQASSVGVDRSAASLTSSSRNIHAGTTVLRYVGGMRGPVRLLPLATSGPAVLRLRVDNRVLEVRLQDIDISLPLMRRSSLIEGLIGKDVFLEGYAEKSEVIAHVYFAAAEGEWTARRHRPLAQLNLSLVEAGVVVPAANLDARYAHFFQDALMRAKADRVGRWSPR